jgi:hypothetical protein
MATNYVYPKGMEAVAGALNLLTDNIKMILVDEGVHPENNGDVYLSDITAGAIIATSGNLAGKTVTNGVFRSSTTNIAGVTGATVEVVYLYHDTGTPATSVLLSRNVCPFTPNGSGCNVNCPASGWIILNQP